MKQHIHAVWRMLLGDGSYRDQINVLASGIVFAIVAAGISVGLIYLFASSMFASDEAYGLIKDDVTLEHYRKGHTVTTLITLVAEIIVAWLLSILLGVRQNFPTYFVLTCWLTLFMTIIFGGLNHAETADVDGTFIDVVFTLTFALLLVAIFLFFQITRFALNLSVLNALAVFIATFAVSLIADHYALDYFGLPKLSDILATSYLAE